MSRGKGVNLDDIIRLQLKKPKHWNWELSTSRSSPHIPLPVIQLFDDKKKLLAETKSYDRRSWHSPENNEKFRLNTDERIRIKEHILKRNSTKIKTVEPSEDLTFRNKRNKEKHKEYLVIDSNKNKYTLRSCSAGTLVIKEDANKTDAGKRRRRKTNEIRHNSSSSDSESQKQNRSTVRRCTTLSDVRAKNSTKSTDYKLENSNNNSKTSDVFNRCLSMGANFSRHSSKGLSGRRCQSISNICNSKDHFLDPSGREVDAAYKFCNSLPSPNGTVYNNNYEHKPLSKKTSLPHTVSEHNVIDPEHQPNECHPLQWKFTDTQTCDQGYGSERSPEEEIPPPIPNHECDYEHTIDFCYSSYPFILPENTFEVELVKGSRGLGLSVCGGVDSDGSWPGLLRIKRLFPHQPAAASGLLQVGDLLLEANGVSLTGLSNYEALEVLRMTPNQVVLLVCRPPPEVISTMSPVSEVPPPPPRRASSPPCLSKLEDVYETEFEILLNKIHGSLGFTLCKEEEGVSGHYVRALVREPAISDGRIQPGDKIVAVNGVEISSMSHEQAVAFLRQCDNEVLLRLNRELEQTPTDLSPTDITPNSSFRPKPHLRQEAVDMLSDLAARKMTGQSPCASPRHLRNHEFESLCSETDDDKAIRPNFLDLYNPNQTPVAVRKSKFNLSLAHNAYELNNLDPEMLDAPNLNCAAYDPSAEQSEEPVSMPPLSTNKSGVFSHKKPAYQSAHVPINTTIVPNLSTSCQPSTSTAIVAPCIRIPCASCAPRRVADPAPGEDAPPRDSKWKEVVFSAERDLIENDAQVLNIELNRGWNSRLGFSLQEVDGCTCVSAVYPDSVAAKDGRIKPGDCLIKVNDEMVENMKTSDVIDLLRIIRGPICITVLRRKPRLD